MPRSNHTLPVGVTFFLCISLDIFLSFLKYNNTNILKYYGIQLEYLKNFLFFLYATFFLFFCIFCLLFPGPAYVMRK